MVGYFPAVSLLCRLEGSPTPRLVRLAKIINTKDSRDRSGPRFYATGDVRQSPKPLDFLRVFLILNLSL